jgi:hypothetical protein
MVSIACRATPSTVLVTSAVPPTQATSSARRSTTAAGMSITDEIWSGTVWP